MSQRDAMTSWHDYMMSQNSFHLYQRLGWLDRWFDRCLCIHGYLDDSIIKCRCLIRKCHSISTGTMTLLYAVTSWSWRLSTISQISFHLTCLDNILQLSNLYVNLVNWHVKIGGILVLLQFPTILWRHIVDVMTDVITCWRQLAKSVSMICLILTTQISKEFV